MPSGGHARSGPAPDPRSSTSDRRGLKFNALPAEGYRGEVPAFPLPRQSRYYFEFEDKRRIRVFDEVETAAFRERELGYWQWAWRTPQAALWATDQWSWVIPAVADWCRLKAQSGDPEAPTAIWTAIRQREGDILLSNDALLRAGYHVVADEVGEKRSESSDVGDAPMSARERAKLLRAVGDE